MSGQKLRPLDLMEQYHSTRVFLGMDTCIALSARYTTVDNTVLTKEILFSALQLVIETHAPLGVRLDGRPDTKDVAFFRLPSIELSRIVEFSDRDLQSALEGQLSRGFDAAQEDLPLWRLEVLPGNIVVLAMHHGIGDGLSTATFHCSLFRALQNTSLPAYSPTAKVPDIPILPPVFDVVNTRPSFFTVLGMLCYALLPGPLNKAYWTWTGNPFPTSVAIRTHTRLISVAPSDAQKLHSACRSHKATITSALYELAVVTLSQLIAALPNAAWYKTIFINLPVSVRPFATVDGNSDLCNYVASVQTFAPLHPTFSWDSAARAAASFAERRVQSSENLGFLSWMGDFGSFNRGQLGKKRALSLILSNIGRVQVPEVGTKWRMGNMFFGQADSLLGPAMAMNVVGNPDGELSITITWGENSLDVGFVEKFVSLFRDTLLGVSN